MQGDDTLSGLAPPIRKRLQVKLEPQQNKQSVALFNTTFLRLASVLRICCQQHPKWKWPTEMKPTSRCHDNVSFCCFFTAIASRSGAGTWSPGTCRVDGICFSFCDPGTATTASLAATEAHIFAFFDLSSVIDPRARGIVCLQWANPTTIRLKSEIRSPCPRDLSALVLQVRDLENGSWPS